MSISSSEERIEGKKRAATPCLMQRHAAVRLRYAVVGDLAIARNR